jgi:hypothetical protein
MGSDRVSVGWATVIGVAGAVCAAVAAYLSETTTITATGIVAAVLLAAATVLGRMWQQVAQTRSK